MAKVLVVGSFNMDMVVRTPRFPHPGETVLGSTFFTAFGGKGANQAVAAARLGAEVTFVARIGSDTFGTAALAHFNQEKIDTRFIVKDIELPTGVAVITLNERGENNIVVAPGANGAFSWNDECSLDDAIGSNDVVVVQLETPLVTVQQLLKRAHEMGKITILNPAPATPLDDKVFKNISILTPNETEAEILTGIKVRNRDTAEQAAKQLHDRGVSCVIITLGSQGAYISNNHLHEIIAAPSVKVIDSTAAGDVFSGALATAIAEGMNHSDAVNMACKAATLSVTRLGAQPSIPYRHELITFKNL